MHGAVMSLCLHLFQMLQSWFDARATVHEPLLPKPLNQWTFRQGLATSAELWILAVAPNVVPSIGRLWWPAQSMRPSGRSWPLNINGCTYPRSVIAANTFPSRGGELYFGIDGGVGFDCHLPHFSGYALEVPNKTFRTTTPWRSN